jgi:tetratricopeptide (TPR) repeat protein
MIGARGTSDPWRESNSIIVAIMVMAISISAFGGLAWAQADSPVSAAAAGSSFATGGDQAYEEQRYQEAVERYSRALKDAPSESSLYLRRAMAYEMLERPSLAAEDYKKALELNSEDYRSMENLAGIYERSGRYFPQAKGLYKKALSLDPRPEWKENLAVWVAMLESREGRETWSAVELLHWGTVLSSQGDTAEAERSYARAIELDPRLYQALFNRGLLRVGLGNREGALEDFDAVIRLCPSQRGALIQRGLLHEEMGHPEKACQDFEMATTVDARDPAAHYHHGRMLEARNERMEAWESYDRALHLRPSPELRRLIQQRHSAAYPAAAMRLSKRASHQQRPRELW